MIDDHDTIAAPATAPGGALAVIRVSGCDAVAVCDRLFRGRTPLSDTPANTLRFGKIMDGSRLVDEVVAALFRAPHSYTGEDTVELSCHGSSYVVGEILRLLQGAGARMARPGEFTIRAYLAGKLDLAQAEAVADLIASTSRAAHALATTQMRGGYSEELEALRDRLLQLTSLLELELDFSDEEVEFADRHTLRDTMERIGAEIERLRRSFSLGNALKQGVAVAIVGAPNVGKSTLLNRLLNEERAMVSEVAGTTRDVIEETIDLGGVRFRVLDTAGIRATDDRLERMGIERTLGSLRRAQIILYLVDARQVTAKGKYPGLEETLVREFGEAFTPGEGQRVLTVVNKTDTAPEGFCIPEGTLGLSARRGEGIEALCEALRATVDTEAVYHGDAVVSNSRHYEALTAGGEALRRALQGLDEGLPTDLLSEEIREVIRHLGEITGRGAIAPDEVLQNIFSKFCIGK